MCVLGRAGESLLYTKTYFFLPSGANRRLHLPALWKLSGAMWQVNEMWAEMAYAPSGQRQWKVQGQSSSLFFSYICNWQQRKPLVLDDAIRKWSLHQPACLHEYGEGASTNSCWKGTMSEKSTCISYRLSGRLILSNKVCREDRAQEYRNKTLFFIFVIYCTNN